MTTVIYVKKTIYDDPDHCSYVMGQDKCDWLGSGPVCQLFRIQLENDTDYHASIKCDECKDAYFEATS